MLMIAGAFHFAKKALLTALLGAMACIGGAGVATALSGSYNICQFFNLQWGKNRPAKDARAFTLAIYMESAAVWQMFCSYRRSCASLVCHALISRNSLNGLVG